VNYFNIYFFTRFRFVLLILIISLSVSCTEDNPEQAFRNGNYIRAFELWKPLAENGDMNAAYYLGLHYYLGLGVKNNHALARQWYEKAAEKGHPSAQLSLGTMYQDGDTVTQNFVTAYMWYYASAIQGNEIAPKKMNILRREMKLFPNQVNQAEELASPYIMNPKFQMNEPPVL